MNKWLNPVIFLAGLFVIGNANATLIKCDNCTSVEMKRTAEEIAGRGANGRHTIKVINMPNSDYKVYQVDKVSSGGGRDPNAEYRLVTSELAVPNISEIKQNITSLNSAISDLREVLKGNVVLPNTFVYRSAVEAMKDPGDFGNHLKDFLNSHHTGLQAIVFDVSALTSAIASNVSVSVGSMVSVTTSLTEGTQAAAFFADGSSIVFQYNFVIDASKGIIINITMSASPEARDSTSRLIPKNSFGTRNYTAKKGDLDLKALADYLGSIGIRITGHNQGEGASCLPDKFACSSDGKVCQVTYRCN
ncbi:hypothetical protein [Rheinheimera soli]|uniref:hypothetical protein n=1 Tax=Rheinheimera soli TaxID=443616 RepID=UPI001E506761|nr:hypothetical protein [Rheinheimera soli]